MRYGLDHRATWVTGVGLSVCTISFGVTGYSLPFDQVSWCLDSGINYVAQPFFVAEFFTNSPGQYVRLDASISGLTAIADGEYDQVDEQAFYLIGDVTTLKLAATS